MIPESISSSFCKMKLFNKLKTRWKKNSSKSHTCLSTGKWKEIEYQMLAKFLQTS